MQLEGKITPTSHYLWDHWTVAYDSRLYRFSLVAPRQLSPDERHFRSELHYWISEDGELWEHRGVAVRPGEPGSFDAQAIWSGCAAASGEPGGRLTLFYTGVAEGAERLQTISAAFLDGDGGGFEKLGRPVLEPTEHPDYDLGAGEAIRAWRDPCVFRLEDGWHMVFSAKRRSPDEEKGALGHAVAVDESLERWELRPPLDLPAAYLQMECPAVVEHDGEIYCFVTTRDRVLSPRDLAVPGNHAGDALRVYRAPALDGPWIPAGRPDRRGGDLVLDAAAANIYAVTLTQVPGRGLLGSGFFTRHHHRAYTWTPWMPVRWHWGRPIMAAP